MKIILIILLVIVLWYVFGRKWQFMRACTNAQSGQTNIVVMDSIDDCEKMYKDFAGSSNVNWMPLAFH